MANHLIIGLGGTGGKVIREFRKRIYEEYRSNTPNDGLFLEYLYMDSSETDINSCEGWKVLGNDISLGAAQKVSTHGINQDVFNNIKAYPGMDAFLNTQDIRLMREKLQPLITDGIGGQRRRLGRVLLANNISDKNSTTNFTKMLSDAVNKLQSNSGQQDVTFHICAGLAGGTGSGSIVDVVSLIRTAYPWDQNTRNFKMRLMLYVPEANIVSPSFNAGFYQANGYAALLELNALSVGAYRPVDITGAKDNITHQAKRLLANQEPFEAAYLYTNANEQGRMLNLGTQLPQAVADFLYQSIILTKNNNQQMSHLVGCENDGAGPENDQAGRPARSRKFMTFGITRVEYPEHEIIEYATYKFAQQAAYQLVYNYWVEGQGYCQRPDDQIGAGFETDIKSTATQEKLMLSDAYLKLEKPIVNHTGTDNWKDISKTWHDLTVKHLENIRNTEDKSSWLNELDKRCSNYYESLFRGTNVGVDNFYNSSKNSIQIYAQAIRNKTEQVLFDEWAAGTGKSVQEIDKYISLLITFCQNSCERYSKKVGELTTKLQQNHDGIKAVRRTWDDMVFRNVFHRAEHVAEKYRAALQVDYIDRTNVKAYEFAKELMTKVIIQLHGLQSDVRKLQERLSRIANEVLEQSQTALVPEDTPTLIKKYNDQMVRNFVTQKTHEFELQKQIAVDIRTKLVQRLDGGVGVFSNLLKITDNDTSSVLLSKCNDTAMKVMQQAAINNPENQMVDVNILNKLQNELTTNKAIADFVSSIISTASVYSQFNQAEAANMLAGGGNAMMSMVQLCIPSGTADNNEFRNNLINAFMAAVPGFDPAIDVSENPKNNQIVVITCKSGFPVRFLSSLTTLRSAYENLVASGEPNAELNKMVLHTETFDSPLPSLYEVTPQEIKKFIERPLLLAFAMNLLEENVDPNTGAKQYCLMQDDDMLGIRIPTPLGTNIASILENLSQNYALATKLAKEVNNALPIRAQHNEQKRIIQVALGQLLEGQIKTHLCQGNNLSPQYAYYLGIIQNIAEQDLKQL